jgi:IclR family transcriptional regulator, acetate operon repressor
MISAVDRAMEIVEALSGDARGATVGVLVERLGIEKSIVSRVLATLERQGYVVREPETNLLRLGLRFVGIGLRHVDRIGVGDLCVPVLRGLSDFSGELVQLAVVDGDALTYVGKAEGTQGIRAQSVVGTQAVLHASTAGRVWLASLPEGRVLELIGRSGLRKLTPRTIDSFDRLQAELARVRAQGFSMLFEELLEGANGIGVPIRTPHSDKVIGAISMGGPAYRFQTEQMQRVLPEMRTAASVLGSSLPSIMPWEIAQRSPAVASA